MVGFLLALVLEFIGRVRVENDDDGWKEAADGS